MASVLACLLQATFGRILKYAGLFPVEGVIGRSYQRPARIPIFVPTRPGLRFGALLKPKIAR